MLSRKYRYFARKVVAVQNSIWEVDFKIAKSRQIREGVRQDRDRAVEAAQQITAAIAAAVDDAQKAELEKQHEAQLENKRRYEAQIKMIDDQINGVPASGENPGQEGLMDTLKAYAELREMYKSFLNSI